MEIRKIVFRKEMKLVTLLLTSMLIATASATVYYGLTMKPKVTTTALIVKFVSGDDSTSAGASISGDGTWVNLAGLKAYPNVTLTYEKAVNVSNIDNTAAHSVSLRHVSITPASGWDVANFTSITFKLVKVDASVAATFAYTVSGTGASSTWTTPSATAYQSIPLSTQWTIRVEIVTKANASTGIAVDIEIALDVQY